MPGGGIYQIVGKTIDRVIVKMHRDVFIHPAVQIFLIFTDNTYYEIYSDLDVIGFPSGLDIGGRKEVLQYLSNTMEVVYEGYLDEEGNPAMMLPRSKDV